MIVSPLNEQTLATLAEQLEHDNDVIALPTETVYGLAAHVNSHKGIEKVFQIKGRPLTNPLIVHTTSIENMAKLFDLRGIETLFESLTKFIPGSLTILAPINYSSIKDFPCFHKNLPLITAGQTWLCCRVPKHQVFTHFLNKLKLPYVVAPSANRSNYVSPTSAEQLELEYRGEITIIDGGVCQNGLESTILKLAPDQIPAVLRYGSISVEELNECLGLKCGVAGAIGIDTGTTSQSTDTSRHQMPDFGAKSQIASPGSHRKHYSPVARVIYPASNTIPHGPYCYIQATQQATTENDEQNSIFSEEANKQNEIAANQLIANATLLYQFAESREGRRALARQIYSIFRECDRIGIGTIIIDPVANRDLGAAINDRILRAMADN